MKVSNALFVFGLVAVIFAYKIPDEHDREKIFLWPKVNNQICFFVC